MAERTGPIPRRKVLRGGLLAALVGLVGAGTLRTTGYSVESGVATRLRALTPWQFVVLEAAARRILAPDDPSDPRIPTPEQLEVAPWIDAYLAEGDPIIRRDFGRLLGYLEHFAPVACGMVTRFSRLSPLEQDRVLVSLEESRIELLRGGASGLKSLAFMAYYRDPRTWRIPAYDGPLVSRPSEGFWR